MIRTTKLRGYIKLLQERSISVSRLLAGTDLSLQALTDPDGLIELEQHDAVVMNLIRLTKESDIAFTVGDLFDSADLGIVLYALLSSKTMRDACGIWIKYNNTLIGSPLRMVLTEQANEEWSMAIASYARNRDLQRFYIEEFLVTGTKIFGLLAAETPKIRQMSLSYPEPPHRAQYERRFDCELSFDAAQTVVMVASPGMSTSIRTNDEELHQVASQHCRKILQQLPRGGGVEPRLRSLFLSRASQPPGIASASDHLGISKRTLMRRLKSNGLSYRGIKDDFRLDLARQYLDSRHLTLKEISHLLGYATSGVFCRAFKTWTGQTPGEYRRNSAQASMHANAVVAKS